MTRTLLAILAIATMAGAQDGAVKPETVSYGFTFDQGWGMMTDSDRGPARVTEAQLLNGIDLPTLLGADNRPTVVQPPTPNRPTTATPANPLSNRVAARPRTRRHDPINATGALTLDGTGAWTIKFDRIEYTDPDQRWWIEFGATKVTTSNLISDKWKGTNDEWPERLGEIEKRMVDHWLKCVTPQPKVATPKLGAAPAAAEDIGRVLYVQTALEEQMTAVVLARLSGRPLTALNEMSANVPERVRMLTQWLLDRLTAQCRGEIAPSVARAQKSRKVEAVAWDYTALAIPCFRWDDGRTFADSRATELTAARRRLIDIVEKSRKTPITDDAWQKAVSAELAAINASPTVSVSATKPGVKEALVPFRLGGPNGTFDFEEKLTMKDGELVVSRVSCSGLSRDQVVRYFDGPAATWRTIQIDYETYFKATVTRK